MAARRDGILRGMAIGCEIEALLAGFGRSKVGLEIPLLPDQQTRRRLILPVVVGCEQSHWPALGNLKAKIVALARVNGYGDSCEWRRSIQFMPIKGHYQKCCAHQCQQVSRVICIDKA